MVPIDELERDWLRDEMHDHESRALYRCVSTFVDVEGALERLKDADRSPLDERLGRAFEELLDALAARCLVPRDAAQECLRAALHEKQILLVRPPRALDLERRLERMFPALQRVVVGKVDLDSGPREAPEAFERAVIGAAASYFEAVVLRAKPDDQRDKGMPKTTHIGFSGGYTMLSLAQELERRQKEAHPELEFISLAGAADPREYYVSANSVAARLATAYGAKGFSLHVAPLTGIQAHWKAEQRIWAHKPEFVDWKDQAKAVRFAFTGVGSLTTVRVSVATHKASDQDLDGGCALVRIANMLEGTRAGDLKTPKITQLIRDLLADDCVGDILYRPIKRDGEAVDQSSEIVQRVVGLSADEIKGLAEDPQRRIFGVASGLRKVSAIYAAAKGGLINGLITDEMTALELERYASPPPAGRAAKRGAGGAPSSHSTRAPQRTAPSGKGKPARKKTGKEAKTRGHGS